MVDRCRLPSWMVRLESLASPPSGIKPHPDQTVVNGGNQTSRTSQDSWLKDAEIAEKQVKIFLTD